MAESSSLNRTRLKCAIIAAPGRDYDDVKRSMITAARDSGLRIISRDGGLPFQLEDTIASELLQADIIVAVLSPHPAVYYEIGLAHAMGKPVISLVDEDVKTPEITARFDQSRIVFDRSSAGLRRLQLTLRKLFDDVIRNPRRFRALSQQAARTVLPEIDFNTLHPREMENLCFELLTQMGYRRVEWGKQLDEIDVVANLPKKDPDGFEYNELWLISLGLRANSEMLLGMAASDPNHLLMRLRKQGLKDFVRTQENPITLLFILFDDRASSGPVRE